MFKNNKICIVVTSLDAGGAERSSALLSKILSDLGFEVHLVSVVDQIGYDFIGELLNLGKIQSNFSLLKRIRKFKLFKAYLKTHNFEYVIDNRTRPNLIKEIIISKFLYKSQNTIYVVRSYNIKSYFPAFDGVTKNLYKNLYRIVAVSDEIKNVIQSTYNFENVTRIYNPVETIQLNNVKSNLIYENYIVFYGRILDEVKNISLLIDAYKLSQLPKMDIELLIIGDGKDLQKLKDKVVTYNFENLIHFKPFTKDPFSYVANAKFTMLTSYYEGFPRVLLESLSIGTPVVSVDCKSGPKEIIINEFNGLLVENHNPIKLSLAMDRMIKDKKLYLKCKANAKDSISSFSMKSIEISWKELLSRTKVIE